MPSAEQIAATNNYIHPRARTFTRDGMKGASEHIEYPSRSAVSQAHETHIF